MLLLGNIHTKQNTIKQSMELTEEQYRRIKKLLPKTTRERKDRKPDGATRLSIYAETGARGWRCPKISTNGTSFTCAVYRWAKKRRIRTGSRQTPAGKHS